MTSRLDRLVTLLESGTTPAVRQTAAKQLGDITKRFFSPDAPAGGSDGRGGKQQVVRLEAGWEEASALVARLLPFLKSKAMETRLAAVDALSHIAQVVPLWDPDNASPGSTAPSVLPAQEQLQSFSVQRILASGEALVASAGNEYRQTGRKRTQEERLKAQKDMLGSVGIQNMDGADLIGDDDMEVDAPAVKVEEAELNLKRARKRQKLDSATASPAAKEAVKPSDPFEGLSGRQVMMLKRKRRAGMGEEEIAEEAMRMRLGVGPSTTPNREHLEDDPAKTEVGAASNAGTTVKVEGGAEQSSSESRVSSAVRTGGAVQAGSGEDTARFATDTGCWIWKPYVDDMAGSLADPAWEVRHGAALGLSAILRTHGGTCGMEAGRPRDENQWLHERESLALAYRSLRTMILDRFGDFVGDQVIAPVREATSQTLASLLGHMSEATLLTVHAVLLDMIFQTWTNDTGATYVWEVRHAGLLGLKYEVALRTDIFGVSNDTVNARQPKGSASDPTERLREVVAAASSGLGDKDDDVRAVSASCLTPIASVLVDKLPDAQLASLLDGLWRCFLVDGDDLGSSIASVMELLSKLLSLPRIIDFYSHGTQQNAALGVLIPRLYPFFRHTIMQVRLILVRTVKVFLENPSLPKEWVDGRIFHLLYENFVLEERDSVRTATAEAWSAALALASSREGLLSGSILVNLGGWLNIAMTPVGDGLDRNTFLSAPPAGSGTVGGHTYDVDKHMLASDLSLVTEEVILRNRISAVKALAEIARYDPNAATHMMLLRGYMLSTSAHQLFLSAVLAEEWALVRERSIADGSMEPLPTLVPASQPVADAFLKLLEKGPMASYYESKPQFELLRRESQGLKQTLERDATTKKRKHEINVELGTIEGAEALVETHFADAISKIPSAKRNSTATILTERKRIIETVIVSYKRLKDALDNRVLSATAAAVVAMRIVPSKLNPIIQNIMRSVKGENYEELQLRAAHALAIFMTSCLDPKSPLPSGPPNKIVSNLANFLCQDESYTPQVLRFPQLEGIMTLGLAESDVPKVGDGLEDVHDDGASFLVRRGAQFALQAIIRCLGPDLLNALPRVWQVMTEALISNLASDQAPELEQAHVQGVVDALTIMETVTPHMDAALHHRIAELLPYVTRASRSKWAVTRKAAATCLATLYGVVPEEGIKAILARVVPLLSDTGNLYHRQGGIEALNLVIQKLDITILPYVLFLIVPVLGRMSDPDPQIRALSTNTFATLVKMIPLEEGMPEPPGFSKEETAKRNSEREFIAQLLDSKKVAAYEIPVKIDAELRPYQKDGVSWLAFLAKYQLHGILCDDMGLGKSLQSICIMASKHEERRIAYQNGHNEEHKPLLSLIVCPPTLIGHWYSEIPKFCDLKPLRYVGNGAQRESIRRKFAAHDVIITSYEAVRADIAYLQRRNFLYCILDEGHAIKNGKSKLSQAIKCLNAVHRLVLSGTPIQNNVLELWSLFDFLMPGFLGTERSFHERFSRPILANREGKATPKQKEAATLALDALHKQVLPFLLRRLKTDVLDDLPPKIIQDYECNLSPVQQRLYDDFAKSQTAKASEAALVRESSGNGQQHIFQSLQYLRKLCNHPMLALNGDEGKLREAIRAASSVKDAEDVPKDILDLRHSPKLLALKQILNDCGIGTDTQESADDMDTMSRHRVLVFCQSRNMLDIIGKLLFAKNMPNVSYMRLDGGTSTLDRHDVAQKFNNDPSIDVLLLTTSIGGLGLTLTGADTVVFVDHDWNPMKDLQAMDRAHRIGQKKVVNVYRLITKGTLEEKIMGLQRFKINVANSVVNQQNSGLSTMNTDQVLDLFTVSADDEAGRSKGGGSGTGKGIADKAGGAVLAGLEDLPPEDEYSSLSLDAFISQS